MVNQELSDRLNELIGARGSGYNPSLTNLLINLPPPIAEQLKINSANLRGLKAHYQNLKDQYEQIIPKILDKPVKFLTGNKKASPPLKNWKDNLKVRSFEEVRKWLQDNYNPNDFDIDEETRTGLFSNEAMKKNDYVMFALTSQKVIISGRFKRLKDAGEKVLTKWDKTLDKEMEKIVIYQNDSSYKQLLNEKDENKIQEFLKEKKRNLPFDVKNTLVHSFTDRTIGLIMDSSGSDFEYYFRGYPNVEGIPCYQNYLVQYGDSNELMLKDIMGFTFIDLNYKRSLKQREKLKEMYKNVVVDGFNNVPEEYDNHTGRVKKSRPGGLHYVLVEMGKQLPVEIHVRNIEDQILHMVGPKAHGIYVVQGKKNKYIV